MMKTLKQILFAMTILIGVSITAAAQKDGDKKPPPKQGNPPVIVVVPKDKPKEEKPKDDKPKKPQAFMFNFRYE